jgi:phage gpG-like protein
MQFNVQIKPKDIAKRVQKRGRALRNSIKLALSRTAQSGIPIIIDNLDKGKGYKGSFKPYTLDYARWKVKPIDQGGGGHSSIKPNLQLTNLMIGAFTTKANSSRAEIFFSNFDANKKAAFNNKTRPFMGFNRRDEKRLRNVFERNLA